MWARRRGAPPNVVWHEEDRLEIHPFDDYAGGSAYEAAAAVSQRCCVLGYSAEIMPADPLVSRGARPRRPRTPDASA